jgi:predicted urease superfamily metal-dependent hydrolase
MKNKDIRIKAIERGVYLWQVASKLGISPESMSRMLRRELEGEKKEKVMQAIEAVAKELSGQPAGTEGGGAQ